MLSGYYYKLSSKSIILSLLLMKTETDKSQALCVCVYVCMHVCVYVCVSRTLRIKERVKLLYDICMFPKTVT